MEKQALFMIERADKPEKNISEKLRGGYGEKFLDCVSLSCSSRLSRLHLYSSNQQFEQTLK